MVNKWKLGEKQLQKLLLVRTVLIGVPKTHTDEEIEHEASESTESERIEAVIARYQHNKAREEK